MRFFYSLLFLFSPIFIFAQTPYPWEVGLGLHLTSYEGDLNASKVNFAQYSAKPSIVLHLRRNLSNNFSGRLNLLIGQLAGDDAAFDEPEWRRLRAITFTSPLAECSALVEVYPFGLYEKRISNSEDESIIIQITKKRHRVAPFLMVGIGGVFTHPKVNWNDVDGNEQINPERAQQDKNAKTKKINIVTPFGAGIRFTLNERATLGLEAALRPTFSDYIDGVSIAGNPNANDWFFGTGLSFSYSFGENKVQSKIKHITKPKEKEEKKKKSDIADNEKPSKKDKTKTNTEQKEKKKSKKKADVADREKPAKKGKTKTKPEQKKNEPAAPTSDSPTVTAREEDVQKNETTTTPEQTESKEKTSEKSVEIPRNEEVKKVKSPAEPKKKESSKKEKPSDKNITADSDGDGVPEDKDECPDQPGPRILKGCPDEDGDGVADAKDECPDQPGPRIMKGCPDEDGDGTPDKNDACPDKPGPRTLKGCPDRDNDGITDKEDACPDAHGVALYRGCPPVDRDKDGVADGEDVCPDMPGQLQWNGCADNDEDGIPDNLDGCPGIKGPTHLDGCPDSDEDGVADKDDICPTLPGLPEKEGCPEASPSAPGVPYKAVYFNSISVDWQEASFETLEEIIAIMSGDPTLFARIEGHTDGSGERPANDLLSEQRAKKCYDYLVTRGVSPKRLNYVGYGSTKPATNGTTVKERQLNRRVEIHFIR